jgi:hypothetical protein
MKTAVTPAPDGLWTWETFLLGGGSILTCMACWAFIDKGGSVLTMSQFAFGLAFAVNHPHFLSSYIMLYHDFGAEIRRQKRHFWAAVVAPLLLGGYLAYSFASVRPDLIGHGINLMYFLVGWHYVKQVFGCVIVTSVRRRVYYQLWERRLLLANLFSLWAASFLQSQTTSSYFSFYGISYAGLQLPPLLLRLAYAAVAASAALVLAMHARKYVLEGSKPTWGGLVAMTALYVWYMPAFSHPAFAYLIPFFHSLQYLAFVWSFKKNQVSDQTRMRLGRDRRQAWMMKFIGWTAAALILGALAFEFVPKALDAQRWLRAPELGSSPFLAAFLLFINIHHYFIDNVLWRSHNPEVKKYLFAPESQTERLRGSARAA